MKVLENKKEKISFLLEIEDSLANAIRRSSLEIPILAIDEVEFYNNDSVLYDEVLALRLGLIPLKTPKDMELKGECKCKGKGCSLCEIELKLNAKGPCIVYSSDLKGKAEVVYDKIPIVELAKDQQLNFLAIARFGKGIQHTKFSPGLVYYSYTPIIEKVSKDKIEKEKIIEVDKETFEKIKNKDKIAFDFLDEYVKFNEEIVYVKPNEKEILFTIESFGQIEAKEIMIKSIQILKDNLKEIK
ncbi:MAG: DNA-directed RNA polymerase subunit D [Candidatus Pacearchaeota archaeon]